MRSDTRSIQKIIEENLRGLSQELEMILETNVVSDFADANAYSDAFNRLTF